MKSLIVAVAASAIALVGCSADRDALDDARKVEFTYETGLMQRNEFQADLTTRTLRYENSVSGPVYGTEEECSLSDEQIQNLLDILKEEEIQDWKEDYREPGEWEDGFAWSLKIETPTGAWEHRGAGDIDRGGAPDNYQEFEDRLDQLAKDCAQ